MIIMIDSILLSFFFCVCDWNGMQSGCYFVNTFKRANFISPSSRGKSEKFKILESGDAILRGHFFLAGPTRFLPTFHKHLPYSHPHT